MEAVIQERSTSWLTGNFDSATKDAIKKMRAENPKELAEAFYRNLEFGTGGLRGIMGVGTNRMNKYTVGMATQGFANYLLQTYPGGPVRVAIAHDCRNNSRFFAETTANVFAANGIKVFYLKHCVRHPSFHLLSVILVARVASFVRHHTIQKNIMGIRRIGMMAANWYPHMTRM